jgi:rod shape-determining protein MreD
MKRVFGYFFLGFLFVVLQTALFPKVLPYDLKPDLVLILIVYLGLHEGYLRGALLSYVLGCLVDGFAGAYPGLYGMAFLMTFLGVRAVARRFNTENSFLLLFMVVCGTLVEEGLLVFPLGYFADAGPLLQIMLRHFLFQILLNLAAAFLLLTLFSLLQKRFAPRSAIPGLRHLGRRYEY